MSDMIEKRVSELKGLGLDWAVAEATGHKPDFFGSGPGDMVVIARFVPGVTPDDGVANVVFEPSTDWSQGGPLIEERPHALPFRSPGHLQHLGKFCARTTGGFLHYGGAPLIAAMRAIVAAERGETVKVPASLVGGSPSEPKA